MAKVMDVAAIGTKNMAAAAGAAVMTDTGVDMEVGMDMDMRNQSMCRHRYICRLCSRRVFL
jgi:hypothetical protein